MKGHIEVVVNWKDYIEDGMKDIVVKPKRTKRRTDYSIDKKIILDNSGKEVILTFCNVDYGGCGPEDYVEDLSSIFKVNKTQLNVLKELVGGYKMNAWLDKKSREKMYKQIKEKLLPLGNPDELLKSMGITDETFYSDVFVFLNEL